MDIVVYDLQDDGEENTLIILPVYSNFSNENQSYDPDAFDGETLIYSWEKQSENDDWGVDSEESSFDTTLDIGLHHFRHRVLDISGLLGNEDNPQWGQYAYVDVNVKGLPQPAQIENLDISSDLYYLELSWEHSEYSEDNWPDGDYEGTPFLANTYEIYYAGQDTPIHAESLPGDITSYVDNSLAPMTEYCYEIYGVNVQSVQSLVQTNCATTGDAPNIDLINPIGGEIVEAGSTYEIDWNIDNSEYVQDISLFYSSDSSVEDNWQLIYSSDDLISPTFIQIPEAEGITIDNLFKVIINDKGDFYNNNSNQKVEKS